MDGPTSTGVAAHLRAGPLLRGRVAVVTGGAGGIGAAVCRTFAEHGAEGIVVADNDAARTATTVAAVSDSGSTAIGVTADLTTAAGVDELTQATIERFGRADILVNGLGHHLGALGPFESTTETQWQGLYEINLLHVFRTCKAFIPGMRERRWGRIVNFSSVEGIRSGPDIAVYTAFKGAVDSFTKSLGVALARDGIRVNAIAVDKTRAYQVNHYALPEEYEHLVPSWIPAGRYGEGDDVAGATLFLSSDLASWVVGQTLPADGGTLAAGGWYRTPTRWTNSPLLVQYLEDDPAINAARPRSLQ
jgi:NAD(P)-dependent dehydrogenase (short-subunit alcohol dehydrogenase family)